MLRDELIKLLQEMPENIPVVIYDPEYGDYNAVTGLAQLKLQKRTNDDTTFDSTEYMSEADRDESRQLDVIVINWF